MAAAFSSTICRGSRNRNMSERSRSERATYRAWYCSKARRSTPNVSSASRKTAAETSRKQSPASTASVAPRTGGRGLEPRPADDLDGPVPLLLQLACALAGEELPLVDHRPLLLRVEVFRIAQEQRQGAGLLRQGEDLRLLRQHQERHAGVAPVLVRHVARSPQDPHSLPALADRFLLRVDRRPGG